MRLEERVRITPTMAAEWLGATGPQRPTDEQRCQRIARDIVAKSWVYQSGVCVCIGPDGGISDGKHRLRACVIADMPILSDVRFGVPLETRWKAPEGVAWTIADRLMAEGKSNAKNLACIVRYLWKWLFSFPTASDTPSPREAKLILDALGGSGQLDTCAARAAQLARKTKSFASCCGALVYLFEVIDSTESARFWDDVESGVGMKRNDPVLTVREGMGNARKGVSISPNRRLAMWVKAWNARRNGQEMKICKWTGDEGFPEIDGLDLEILRKKIAAKR